MSSTADIAACRRLLRNGSRTFFVASLLLPARVREPASALYAFCRLADDAIDVDGRVDALTELRGRLALAYDGQPRPIAADRAFADVVARYGIPRALPEALFEGFEWDAQGRRYEDLAELRAYAARVAGSVGAMMAMIMGARSPEALARACDLGVAMQLSNIARDVGEDARSGRIYLPLQWLREAGIDPDAFLASPVISESLREVIGRLLHAAEDLYERASAGIADLPWDCRPAIHAARILYAEIGRQLERSGLDAVSSRTVVPLSRKARLLADAIFATAVPAPRCVAEPLDETRFLVDAAAQAVGASDAVRVPAWNVYERIIRLIQLFERLERREQFERAGLPEIRV